MTLFAKIIKLKTCAACKTAFRPNLPMAKVCSPFCALSLARSKRGKAEKVAAVKERKADAVKREKHKSLADYIKAAQTAFNGFIRARDQLAGHACISSGRPLDWTGNKVDAGHFRSRGAAPHLRFDERNCHAQSKYDNLYKAGNVSGYRLGLIARIGLEQLEALEADQTTRKYTRDDLKAIKALYTQKTNALKTAQKVCA